MKIIYRPIRLNFCYTNKWFASFLLSLTLAIKMWRCHEKFQFRRGRSPYPVSLVLLWNMANVTWVVCYTIHDQLFLVMEGKLGRRIQRVGLHRGGSNGPNWANGYRQKSKSALFQERPCAILTKSALSWKWKWEQEDTNTWSYSTWSILAWSVTSILFMGNHTETFVTSCSSLKSQAKATPQTHAITGGALSRGRKFVRTSRDLVQGLTEA